MNDPHDTLAQLQAHAQDPALRRLSATDFTDLFHRALTPRRSAAQPGVPSPTPSPRWQDPIIDNHIPHGATVLDLGCGEGDLLARLIRNKNIRAQGIEVDPDAVFHCVEKGVPVLQADLDLGLRGFADQSFDYVVLEETLQTLHRPAEVLQDMLRVGRHGIVSFPNFAHATLRLDLLLHGRMPITHFLPYQWHDTPNIHLLSIQDFIDWAAQNNVNIAGAFVLTDSAVRPLQPTDNLYAEEALFIVNANQPK